MRLIRRKLYRAFPELDRFTDEQCARFVHAANSSWIRRSGRWLVVGTCTLVLVTAVLGGTIALSELFDRHLKFWDAFAMVWWGGMLILGVGTSMVAGLVLRDWILRRRVRQLIARCGTCPKCHYSLLGIRVGDDLAIVCPECGREMQVDPAMGELAIDEAGAPVYRPRVARDDAATVAERRRRHRRFFKWGAAGAAGFAALLGAAYGGWWWWLTAQAKQALSERRTRQAITGLREAMWRTGPEPESTEEFCRFTELVRAAKELNTKRDKMPEYTSPNGRFLGWATDVIDPFFDRKSFDRQNGAESFEPTRRYVLDILNEGAESGLFDSFREILRMRAPIREYDHNWKDPFVGVLLPDLGATRAMARINSGRMVRALHAGNRTEYVDAMEETLAGAQIVERQGLFIEQLVGIAIRALVHNRIIADRELYPDAIWTQSVLDAMARRSEMPGMWRSMAVEKVACMDTMQWIFSQPKRVQRVQLGLGNPDLFGFAPAKGWCGGYQGNRAAMDAYFDPWIADLALPSWKQGGAALPTTTGYVILDQLVPSVARASRSEHNVLAERNRCIALLAADMHRWNTGEYPTSVHQLRPYVSVPELLIDPGCGLPYRVGLMQEPGQAAPVFEIMQGDDDRPAGPPPPAPKPASKPISTKK